MRYRAFGMTALALGLLGCGDYDAADVDQVTAAVRGPIPSGWTATKVGTVNGTVSAQYDPATTQWYIVGGGAGFKATTGQTGPDNFYFINRPLSGDGEITISPVATVGDTAAVRAEIRATLGSTSAHAAAGFRFSPFTTDAVYRAAGGGAVTAPTVDYVGPYYKMVRRGNVVTAYHSWDQSSWQRLDPDVSLSLSGLSTTAYYGIAVSSGSGTATAEFFMDSVSAGRLPRGLVTTVIGGATPAGGTTVDYDVNGGTFTVQGGGAGITGTADSFQFTTRTLVGDGTVIARILPANGTFGPANGGLMLRRNLNSNASNVFVSMNNSDQLWFSKRTTSGGFTSKQQFSGGPYGGWVKLVRTGTTVATYSSTDGQTWTSFATATLGDLGTTAYVGFAATNNANGQLATVPIDGLQFLPSNPQ